MKKLSTWLMLMPLAVLLCVAGTIAVAGVYIQVVNKTGSHMDEIVIYCEYGKMTVAALPPAGTRTQRLGKIGEGALFSIKTRQKEQCSEAKFDVYFKGFWPLTFVTFEVLQDGRVQMFQDGKLDLVQTRSVCR